MKMSRVLFVFEHHLNVNMSEIILYYPLAKVKTHLSFYTKQNKIQKLLTREPLRTHGNCHLSLTVRWNIPAGRRMTRTSTARSAWHVRKREITGEKPEKWRREKSKKINF